MNDSTYGSRAFSFLSCDSCPSSCFAVSSNETLTTTKLLDIRAPSILHSHQHSIIIRCRTQQNLILNMLTAKVKKMTIGKKSKPNCSSAQNCGQTYYDSDGPVMYWMKKLDDYRRKSKSSISNVWMKPLLTSMHRQSHHLRNLLRVP